MSQTPLIKTSGKVFLTPLQVSSSDIGEMLESRQKDSKIFNKLSGEVHRVNQLIQDGAASPLVYSMTIAEVDSASATLRLHLENGSSQVENGSSQDSRKALAMKIVPAKDSETKNPLFR